jgi:Sulfotransferase family
MELIRDFAMAGDMLIAQASAATGLSDFGADFGDGYQRFLEGLEHEAGLTDAGRMATAGFIFSMLTARLIAQKGIAALPADAPAIRRPLIITGIVRSGTTALHRLLAIDPQFQGMEHWLTRTPMPRPPRSAWAEMLEYQQSSAIVEMMITQAPEFFEDHMMSVDGVEESINILAQGFTNNMLATQWCIPTYDAWYRRQDETPSYQYFARILQLMGSTTPDKTWLLKNPTDTFAMNAVLNVFPDAMIVQTHRDPVQAVPSVVNLIHAARRMFADADAPVAEVMAREAGFWAEALARCDKGRVRALQQFCDIEFSDFIRDQMGSVKAIYAHFGLELRPEVETAMRNWLSNNPRRSTKLQRFTAESFNMQTSAVAALYAKYRAQRGYA